MDKILERYDRYSYAEKALISAESESEVRSQVVKFEMHLSLFHVPSHQCFIIILRFVWVRSLAYVNIYGNFLFLFFEQNNKLHSNSLT